MLLYIARMYAIAKNPFSLGSMLALNKPIAKRATDEIIAKTVISRYFSLTWIPSLLSRITFCKVIDENRPKSRQMR
ncbi:hypothetical protein D3C84_1269610 [compost metagenome]